MVRVGNRRGVRQAYCLRGDFSLSGNTGKGRKGSGTKGS